MEIDARTSDAARRPRPGGRNARVRKSVLAATIRLLAECGFQRLDLPDVARQAGVHPTTVYRRWPTKSRLVGEALLEQSRPLAPTPDTGALRTDLEALLAQGAELIRTPAVLSLFEVLLSEWANPSPEIAIARDRFWAAHLAEMHAILERAWARSELPAGSDPIAFLELAIGPALVRTLFRGSHLEQPEIGKIVSRVLRALGANRDEN